VHVTATLAGPLPFCGIVATTLGPRRGRSRTATGGLESACESVLVIREQMTVSVHRRAYVGMAKVALYRQGVGALIDQKGNARMAHFVRVEGHSLAARTAGSQNRDFQLS
jgi:hypothetical protein